MHILFFDNCEFVEGSYSKIAYVGWQDLKILFTFGSRISRVFNFMSCASQGRRAHIQSQNIAGSRPLRLKLCKKNRRKVQNRGRMSAGPDISVHIRISAPYVFIPKHNLTKLCAVRFLFVCFDHNIFNIEPVVNRWPVWWTIPKISCISLSC